MIFEKLANGITKHAKLIVIIWIIVLLASIYPAMHSVEKLSYNTGSMGSDDTESIKGMSLAGEHFISLIDTTNAQSVIVTYNKDDAAAVANAAALKGYLISAISGYEKIASVMDGSSGGLITLAVTYKQTYSSGQISDDTGNLRKIVSDTFEDARINHSVDTSGMNHYVTGSPAISYDASKTMAKDMSLVDPISIFLILVLVGLFFRSFVSSAAPPITIGVAFALVMCAMFFLGQVFEIFYIVEMLLLVSMLGAGCDYCIFILARYREERKRGLEHIEASRQAIIWAGESVFTSGIAVMIGFGSMMICDFNLVSTMGLGLAVGIVFALLAALTLMSSLVVLLGDRLFWPSGAYGEKHERGYMKKMGDIAHSYFTKSTRFSIKHAKAIIVATILFTVPMVYVYATSENSYDMIGSMMSGESKEGMAVITDSGSGGSIMPNYAIIETDIPLGEVTYVSSTLGMLELDNANVHAINSLNTALATEVLALENVDKASGPQFVTWYAIWTQVPIFDADTKLDVALGMMATQPQYAILVETIQDKILTPENRALVQDKYSTMKWTVGDEIVGKIMDWTMLVAAGSLGVTMDSADHGVVNYYKFTMSTKDQAMANDSIDTVSQFTKVVHNFVDNHDGLKAVWVTGTAAVMVEISDMMTSQFLKIELTAVILIVLLLLFVMKSYFTPVRSVLTILMSVIWTVAITHLLFTDVLHAGVLWVLPIILLVICLGLGMDYDILLTTRIREYRFAKGMSNDEAISQAVLHSGSVITICGLIMAGTFGTMMLSSTVMLQQMGFALCFAILVDALIIRTYIVPAAMHLMGEWNWKGPFKSSAKKIELEQTQE